MARDFNLEKKKIKIQKDNAIESQLINLQHTHQHIVKFMGVIWDGSVVKTKEDPNPQLVYSGYVMEFMELGSLHEGSFYHFHHK